MVNGKMINRMDMDKKLGLIKQFTKANIRKEENMEKVNFYGRMIVPIKGNSLKIISMDLGNIYGKMVEFMKENGKTTKCKEKEYFYG